MNPEQAKQQYDAQGYVLIPQALGAEELRRVREAFDRAAGQRALRDILNQDDVFVDMADHPVLLPIVRAMVGEDAQLRYAQGGIIRPHSDSGSGWHCDLSELMGVYLPNSVVM